MTAVRCGGSFSTQFSEENSRTICRMINRIFRLSALISLTYGESRVRSQYVFCFHVLIRINIFRVFSPFVFNNSSGSSCIFNISFALRLPIRKSRAAWISACAGKSTSSACRENYERHRGAKPPSPVSIYLIYNVVKRQIVADTESRRRPALASRQTGV